jgi:hypothetical protein
MGHPDSLFVSAVPEFFQCGICSETFKNCFITACNHRYCSQCLHQIIQTQNGKCAYDRKTIKIKECKEDKSVNEFISQLLVKCPNLTHNDCEWFGQLSDLNSHLKEDEMKGEIPKFNEKYLTLLEKTAKNDLILQLQKKCEEQHKIIEKLTKSETKPFTTMFTYQNGNYKKEKNEKIKEVNYTWSEISESSKYMEIVQE